MLGKTDRHYRYIARLLTRYALLYTGMITTGAILKGDTSYQLRYHPAEHPVALQLGGSNPAELQECAMLAQDYGYDEINLNIGCPSDRVQNGMFGACLMAQPEQVADCVSHICSKVDIPVTVKHRIGIDHRDSYEELCRFIEIVSAGGCNSFIIHARKAWLQGLSPKENRQIPPLDYARVYQIKQRYPDLEIIINGGIRTHEACKVHLQKVDGVMLGHSAYDDLYLLRDIDASYYGQSRTAPSRKHVIEQLLPYIVSEVESGTHAHHITRHILGLFRGMAGARLWRRHFSSHQLTIADLKNLTTKFE